MSEFRNKRCQLAQVPRDGATLFVDRYCDQVGVLPDVGVLPGGRRLLAFVQTQASRSAATRCSQWTRTSTDDPAALETSTLRAMQHWPTLAGATLSERQTWPDVAVLTACSGLSLGSGWAAAPHFDATQPSRKPPLRAKTRPFAGALVMEPTGIERVTSCLQNGTTDPLYGLIFRRLCGFAVPAPPRGYGGIRRDQAGFGQRNRTAAQRILVVVFSGSAKPSRRSWSPRGSRSPAR